MQLLQVTWNLQERHVKRQRMIIVQDEGLQGCWALRPLCVSTGNTALLDMLPDIQQHRCWTAPCCYCELIGNTSCSLSALICHNNITSKRAQALAANSCPVDAAAGVAAINTSRAYAATCEGRKACNILHTIVVLEWNSPTEISKCSQYIAFASIDTSCQARCIW